MKYALVIIECSKVGRESASTLAKFAESVLGETRQIPIERMLNAGAYLLPLENGLHELSRLVTEAHGRGLQTRTLFFDQAPCFVTSEIL